MKITQPTSLYGSLVTAIGGMKNISLAKNSPLGIDLLIEKQ
jgi:hypothetical protein